MHQPAERLLAADFLILPFLTSSAKTIDDLPGQPRYNDGDHIPYPPALPEQ